MPSGITIFIKPAPISQLENTKQPLDPSLCYALCSTDHPPPPPSHPLHPTSHPSLPLMPFPWVRQVTQYYLSHLERAKYTRKHYALVSEINKKRWKEGVEICRFVLVCCNSCNASRIHFSNSKGRQSTLLSKGQQLIIHSEGAVTFLQRFTRACHWKIINCVTPAYVG